MTAKLLRQIEFWQRSIARQLLQRCPEVPPSELVTLSQRLVLAVLWLLLCHQRGVSIPQQWFGTEGQGTRLYLRLLTGLQQVNEQLGQVFPLALPECLPVGDDLLSGFINRLWAASKERYPSQLLGQVYEQSFGGSIAGGVEESVEQHTRGRPQRLICKKGSGIYYTPEAIIKYILEQTIDSIIQEHPFSPPSFSPSPPSLRILDPSCGGGAFLLAAYQRLLDWTGRSSLATEGDDSGLQRGSDKGKRLTQAERSHILQTHIFGVDLDPQAVAVTQLSLWLKLLEDLPHPLLPPLPSLSHNIRSGNAVMNREGGFEWEREFAEILQAGGFDVVIGNPPYIDSEWMTIHLSACRHYCSQHYQSATGNWDFFCVFIEKAIDLCRPGGLISLVVPNKLASADYARRVRHLLSQEHQLLTLRDYAQVPVFAASVYPLVFVARKRSSSASLSSPVNPSPVRYEWMQDLQQVHQARSIDLHASSAQLGWRLSATEQQSALLARLQQDFSPLGNIAHIRGAATVTEAYQMQSLIQNIPVLTAGDLQVVNSGTIDRYQLLWGKKPLRYLGQSYLYPGIAMSRCNDLPPKRYQQAQQCKIIVAGMTQRLECAFDPMGCILAGKSTSIVWVEEGAIDLRYLLGLLNSSLLSFYFNHSFHGNQLQGGYFRVGPPQLRLLPICLPDLTCASDRQDYQQMIAWVTQRLVCQLKTKTQHLDHAIDRLVWKLYRLTDVEMEAMEKYSDYEGY